jgi:hypothetical protein
VTTLTLRYIRGDFLLTGPDIEPLLHRPAVAVVVDVVAAADTAVDLAADTVVGLAADTRLKRNFR